MFASLQNNENHFEWEDSKLIDYLAGDLPKIRDYYDKDKKIETELKELKKIYSSYDCYKTNGNKFVQDIKEIITQINTKVNNWYGIDIANVEYYMKLQHSCLLFGEGGIGKSYFIFKLEEALSNKNIKHLCIYGKYQKELSAIDFSEIIKISFQEQFVFIIDAVNELPEDEQINLLSILQNLKRKSNIRIVLTYRTYSLDGDYLKELRKLIDEDYKFSGVSFEAALEVLSRYPLKDINAYTDILFSNNALLISNLIKILLNKQERTDLDSITNVTYILEHDFKECLRKHAKILKKDWKVYWEETKRIVNWMFTNNRKDIPENILATVLQETNVLDYFYALDSMGYIIQSSYKGINYIYFASDSLIDYLLSRSLFNELDNLKDTDVIKLINSKITFFPSAIESFILVIFDKYKNDYKRIHNILVSANLLSEVTFDLLVKIVMKKENINSFLKFFSPKNPEFAFLTFAGYTNKPFNCTNYFNKYFLVYKTTQLHNLSYCLSNNYKCLAFSRRLKNMIYYLILGNADEETINEYFYTGLWATSAPNENVRILARKLLFETVRIKPELIKVLINIFSHIQDYYIRNAIIETLYYHKNFKSIQKFFSKLKNNESYISAKDLALIASYLGKPLSYIKWNKINLFKKTSKVISDEFGNLLLNIDMYEKHLLNFRYWSKTRIDNEFPRFINISKNSVIDFNRYLEKHYSCVKHGECNGSGIFKEYALKMLKEKHNKLPTISFLKSFEKIVFSIYSLYSYSEREDKEVEYYNFGNSIQKKLICIAQDIFYGSLMCNYFTEDFASYNNDAESIGFEVYNPFEYKSGDNYTAPIPIYNHNIEKLQNLALCNIDVSMEKNEIWVKDAELTKRNVLSIIESPIQFAKKEWILLATQIFLKEDMPEWRDNYDISCCVSNDFELHGDENDRYLTIEHRDYQGLLEDYCCITSEESLCKKVGEISYQSNIFDETNLLLPPAKLIRDLQLYPNYKNLSWINKSGEEIIVCNNTKSSYYKDNIKSSIFIRKDVFDNYIKDNVIKYFVYTERLIGRHSYEDDTNFHLEIQNGKIVKEFYNRRVANPEQHQETCCTKCKYGLDKKHERCRNKPLNINFIKLTLEEFNDLQNIEISNLEDDE